MQCLTKMRYFVYILVKLKLKECHDKVIGLKYHVRSMKSCQSWSSGWVEPVMRRDYGTILSLYPKFPFWSPCHNIRVFQDELFRKKLGLQIATRLP